MLDLIARDAIIWTDDPAATFIDDSGTLLSPDSELPADSKRVLAVKIGVSPFAVRIASMPLETFQDSNTCAQCAREGPGIPTPAGVAIGIAQLSVINTAADRDNFTDLYKSMAANNTIIVNEIALTTPFFKFVDQDGGVIHASMAGPGYGEVSSDKVERNARITMNFRFPPIPPLNGFNIFGPLNAVKLSGARGSVWVRSQLIDLPAPAEVEVTGIEALEAKNGVVTVPLQARDDMASFDFKMTAHITVNGDTHGTVSEKYSVKPIFEFCVLMAGVAEAIFLLILAARYQRDSRPEG